MATGISRETDTEDSEPTALQSNSLSQSTEATLTELNIFEFEYESEEWSTEPFHPPVRRVNRIKKNYEYTEDINYTEVTYVCKLEVSVLSPTRVDLHPSTNRHGHLTDEYELPELIVRRGVVFKMTVTFNRPYFESKDKIVLRFVTGHRPMESKSSIIRIPVTDVLTEKGWGARILNKSHKNVSISIKVPPDAAIGQYWVCVETETKTTDERKPLTNKPHHSECCFFVLFNAWCEDDNVFLKDEDCRKEYILNESGLIWIGSTRRQYPIPWNFGQFEDVSLLCCLWLIDKARLSVSARGDPVAVAQCIAEMVNDNGRDRGGVLCGRWSRDMPPGSTSPSAWTGSVRILTEFWATKKSVKYGQCWVFAGLVTTLCRALGIPARCVTNFSSAHDHNANMTIDRHFDESGGPMEELDDLLWNFHVWNEVWFKRPDLPGLYDGWQTLDATPQEQEFFQWGPCPVEAVKNGDIYLSHATKIKFAEVNAHMIYWEVESSTGAMKVLRTDRSGVGKCISTKAVGSNERQDLTHNYKYEEGSWEERQAVESAFKYSPGKGYNMYETTGVEESDTNIELEIDETVMMGQPINIVLLLKNNTTEKRTAVVTMATAAASYMGVRSKNLKQICEELVLAEDMEVCSTVVTISPQEYISKLRGDLSIKVFVHVKIKETGQQFATHDVVEFTKPKIKVTLKQVSRQIEAKLSFMNPLPSRIWCGTFYIEATGTKPKDKVITCIFPVGQNKEVTATAYFTPYRRSGDLCRVTASFQSCRLNGVRGTGAIHVQGGQQAY